MKHMVGFDAVQGMHEVQRLGQKRRQMRPNDALLLVVSAAAPCFICYRWAPHTMFISMTNCGRM